MLYPMEKKGETIYIDGMSQSDYNLCIRFDTNWGCFQIARDPQRGPIFTLSIETPSDGEQFLGDYCSISDAISAVSQQRSGYPEWDQRASQELPIRVHDIACWNFQQNLGTIPRSPCSQ